MKINAEFYFKVFGLAKDEKGNVGFAYIDVCPKTNDDKIAQIEETEYDSMHDAISKVVAEQLGIEDKKIEKITKEEYLERTGGEL